jgi:hypothetical protein
MNRIDGVTGRRPAYVITLIHQLMAGTKTRRRSMLRLYICTVGDLPEVSGPARRRVKVAAGDAIFFIHQLMAGRKTRRRSMLRLYICTARPANPSGTDAKGIARQVILNNRGP